MHAWDSSKEPWGNPLPQFPQNHLEYKKGGIKSKTGDYRIEPKCLQTTRPWYWKSEFFFIRNIYIGKVPESTASARRAQMQQAQHHCIVYGSTPSTQCDQKTEATCTGKKIYRESLTASCTFTTGNVVIRRAIIQA